VALAVITKEKLATTKGNCDAIEKSEMALVIRCHIHRNLAPWRKKL